MMLLRLHDAWTDDDDDDDDDDERSRSVGQSLVFAKLEVKERGRERKEPNVFLFVYIRPILPVASAIAGKN